MVPMRSPFPFQMRDEVQIGDGDTDEDDDPSENLVHIERVGKAVPANVTRFHLKGLHASHFPNFVFCTCFGSK